MAADLLIQRPHAMALPAQAMAEAFMAASLVSCISDNFPVDLLGPTGLGVFIDPPLTNATPLPLPGQRTIHIYSARFSMTQARAIADYHNNHSTLGFFEAASPYFEGITNLRLVLLPPLPLWDTNTANPLRKAGIKARICIPHFPVPDQQIRQLQKEYLLDPDENYSLTFLEPSTSLGDLTERYYAFQAFYLPVESKTPLWNFDLSCLITAGAMISGAVPPLIADYCPQIHSLRQAVKASKQAGQPETNTTLTTLFQKQFVETVTTLH